VRQRDVAGQARLGTEGQADDFRAHLVERIGFGVQRHQLRRFDALQPGFELVPGEDGVVVGPDLVDHGVGVCVGDGEDGLEIIDITSANGPLIVSHGFPSLGRVRPPRSC